MRRYVIGIGAALVFVFLTGIHLDGPGFYYDELHQAPASFYYLGSHPSMFTHELLGVPALTMSYGGAIKSHVYGLYLKFVNPHFTAFSWRLLGILFVAGGLFGFYWIAGPLLSLGGATLFAVLLLTDATVLLTSRYDWGPTALALGLRLLFLAVWLSMELDEPTPLKHFAAGLIVGIALFEKLVAVVLMGPLLVLLFAARKTSWRGPAATAAGLFAGTVPLLLANIGSYMQGGGFISLADVSVTEPLRFAAVIDYAFKYVSLGQGELAGRQVLDDHWRSFWPQAETALMLAALLLVGVLAVRHRRSDRLMTVAGRLVLAYGLVAVSLLLLPHDTNLHHWIQATPFQYAAIAVGTSAISRPSRAAGRRALLLIAVGLIAVRIPNIVVIEPALAYGKSSTAFDPAFNRIGEIAARRSKEAIFLSADWGTGTQLYCFGNGQDDLVYEPFWSRDPAGTTREIAATTTKRNLYIVVTGLATQFAESAEAIARTVANSSEWEEAPVEKELTDLTLLKVRKFVRRKPPP